MTELNQKTGGQELVITRVFNAPRELVWKTWTEPEHLMQWWGPRGFTSPVIKMDFRIGGKSLECMRSPEGEDYWSTGSYREIVEREKIVTTDSFSDAQGNVVPASRYGMSGNWPLELLVTVTFEDVGDETQITLRHEGIPSGENRDSAESGWNESFDKLAEYLMEIKKAGKREN